jgi:Fe-S cluster assembly protein SufD
MTHDSKNAFLEAIMGEHAANLKPNAAFALFMKKAFDHFLEIGLPDKKHPDYTYFPLTKLYEKKAFDTSAQKVTKESILEKVLPECQDSFLVIKNGCVDLELSCISGLAKSVIIEALDQSQSPYMPFIHAKLVSKQKHEKDPFVLLCQSQLQGQLIIIPENTKLTNPLQLIYLTEQDKVFPTVNTYIHVGKKASVELVLTSVCNQKTQIGSYIDLDLDSESDVQIVRSTGDSIAMMFDTMSIHLKKDAKVKIVDISQPEAPSKFHLHVIHEKTGADSAFHALSVIDEKKDYHVSTNFEHLQESSTSYQHVKTVLKSKAKASFSGQIHVHKEALLTQSYQKHATLMLGKHGMINSRPNLRIFADDVKASHGATIAELDKDALFYLKTRGLDETSSKQLLLNGFCREIIQEISSEGLKEAAMALIQKVQDYDAEDSLTS